MAVGAAGEGQEDIVEVGGADGQAVHLDRLGVEPVEQRRSEWTPPSFGELQGEALLVARAAAERDGGAVERGRVAELEPDAAAGDEPLELGRRALGDDAAARRAARSGSRAGRPPRGTGS